MAKANGGGGEETIETGDAPLIDLNEGSIKKLIARAKKRGYITYDQLNEMLPQDQFSSEQIEDIMAALSDMGVNVVENEETEGEGEGGEVAVREESAVAGPVVRTFVFVGFHEQHLAARSVRRFLVHVKVAGAVGREDETVSIRGPDGRLVAGRTEREARGDTPSQLEQPDV